LLLKFVLLDLNIEIYCKQVILLNTTVQLLNLI